MKRTVLMLCVLCVLPLNGRALDYRQYVGTAVFSDSQSDLSGMELNFSGFSTHGGIQAAFAKLYDERVSTDYQRESWAYSLAYMGKFDLSLTPYLAGGVLVRNERRRDCSNGDGTCDRRWTRAELYPEIGILFVSDYFFAQLYGRRYYEDRDSAFNVVGIAIGSRWDMWDDRGF